MIEGKRADGFYQLQHRANISALVALVVLLQFVNRDGQQGLISVLLGVGINILLQILTHVFDHSADHLTALGTAKIHLDRGVSTDLLGKHVVFNIDITKIRWRDLRHTVLQRRHKGIIEHIWRDL